MDIVGTMRDWDREKKQQNKQNYQTNGTNQWKNNQMKDMDGVAFKKEHFAGSQLIYTD